VRAVAEGIQTLQAKRQACISKGDRDRFLPNIGNYDIHKVPSNPPGQFRFPGVMSFPSPRIFWDDFNNVTDLEGPLTPAINFQESDVLEQFINYIHAEVFRFPCFPGNLQTILIE
jgi:hypothetical protein